MMPDFAFASLFGEPPCSIDPVRSSTITMSIGFAPHGWQAVALAPMFIELMPNTRAKAVSAVPWAVTCTAFTGCAARAPRRCTW